MVVDGILSAIRTSHLECSAAEALFVELKDHLYPLQNSILHMPVNWDLCLLFVMLIRCDYAKAVFQGAIQTAIK